MIPNLLCKLSGNYRTSVLQSSLSFRLVENEVILFFFIVAEDMSMCKSLLSLVIQVNMHFYTLNCRIVRKKNSSGTQFLKAGITGRSNLLKKLCNLLYWVIRTLSQYLVYDSINGLF